MYKKIGDRFPVVAGLGILAALAAALLAFAGLDGPDSTTTNTFKNNEKDNQGNAITVTDLHILYNTPITAIDQLDDPDKFGSVGGIASNNIKLSNGSIGGGGTVQITATGQANQTVIRSWFWTAGRDHHQVGATKKDCHPPDCTSP